MRKESLTQVQEVQRGPYKINPRRKTTIQIVLKLTKIKDKENNIKSNNG